MRPVPFKEANALLTPDDKAPRVFVRHTSDGQRMLVTKFKLEKGELEIIKATGCVWIAAGGDNFPLIVAKANSPFGKSPHAVPAPVNRGPNRKARRKRNHQGPK